MKVFARVLFALGLLLSSPVLAEPGACLIAIDVGHTRENPGEISARGRPEREFNATLAGRLRTALRGRGISSVLINPHGELMALVDRPRMAAEAGAALLISIHHDSVQDIYKSEWEWGRHRQFYSDQFSGYGLFVSEQNPAFADSLRVAEKIADGLLLAGLTPSLHHAEAIAGENRPLLNMARGIYRYDNLIVLKYATIPAVLLEAGIIVNRAEELKLRQPAYQDKIAAAVAAAVEGYCGGR